MNEQEQRAVLGIAVLAAFADGSQSDAERAQIQRIAEGFHLANADVTASYQQVLGAQSKLKEFAQQLQSSEAKSLACEMAVCVCHADNTLSEAEQQFLSNLRSELQLPPQATGAIENQASDLTRLEPAAAPPVIQNIAGRDAELDNMVLNYAILTGALELLPHSLATMAIIPIQIRMVYRVGQHYGFDLSRGHIKEFLGTIGIGLSSQVVESFARRLLGGVSRQIAGRLVGGLVSEATGSAVAFGTTYALGQVAKRYYASGRTLTTAQLRDVFTSLLSEGNALQSRYANDIFQKSRQINVRDLLPIVRQS
jgi:uncharacterized protein (DUF697 family)/tellurite resistance protein